MATIRQRELARSMVENLTSKNKKNKKELLVSVGYTKTVAETKPNEIMEQKGVKEALKNDFGLTEELIKSALVDDLKSKKGNRLGEMRLGSDILGLTKVPEGGSKTLVINISGESASRYGLLDNVKDSMSKLDEPKKD